ncbi:hypothetical protein KPL40_18420 [Clostridium gasigenes]|uniref:HNH endonuclease domain-containing protein n=1 Tax=Clostridium gasigenes TaxID=94869 RepID=UPI001C0B1439|nr:HNH endonuclease domain-containing protein [Clostridium gasigenes]MBU3134392.1 hypothetical protein [Clostridium gasigenes]
MATKYWKEIIENSKLTDIYTGEGFNNSNYEKLGNVSIDHFMPWSFIGHDKLWNLVPTFKNVNSSKSDNLPSLEKYFESFKEMQFKGVDFMRKRKNGTKYLEDYLDVNKELDLKGICSINGVINRERFYRDIDNTIKPIYQIAYNQGYGEWEYRNRGLEYKEIIREEMPIYK